MNERRIYLFVATFTFVAFLFSCTQDVQTEFTDNSTELSVQKSFFPEEPLTQSELIALAVERKGTYLISESEASEKLARFATSDGRSDAVEIESATLKVSPLTGKDLFYEITFNSEKGKGFSLVSADERVPEVLFYTDFGSISDTTFNKSLKFCLDLVSRYVEAQVKEDLDVTSLALSANKKLDGTQSRGPACRAQIVEMENITNRLRLVPGGWHQNSPYNDNLPYVAGTSIRPPVGCAMIGVTQIMAYYKKYYNLFLPDVATWNLAIANHLTSSTLHSLIYDVFMAMKLPAPNEPTIYSTPSTIEKARDFLNDHGFTAGAITNYSFSGVWTALNPGPTFICGWTGPGTAPGHGWVVDGARIVTIEEYMIEDPPCFTITFMGSYDRNYLRFDWGWGPLGGNGWFSAGVFQASSWDPNFNYDVKYINSIN